MLFKDILVGLNLNQQEIKNAVLDKEQPQNPVEGSYYVNTDGYLQIYHNNQWMSYELTPATVSNLGRM